MCILETYYTLAPTMYSMELQYYDRLSVDARLMSLI